MVKRIGRGCQMIGKCLSGFSDILMPAAPSGSGVFHRRNPSRGLKASGQHLRQPPPNPVRILGAEQQEFLPFYATVGGRLIDRCHSLTHRPGDPELAGCLGRSPMTRSAAKLGTPVTIAAVLPST